MQLMPLNFRLPGDEPPHPDDPEPDKCARLKSIAFVTTIVIFGIGVALFAVLPSDRKTSEEWDEKFGTTWPKKDSQKKDAKKEHQNKPKQP